MKSGLTKSIGVSNFNKRQIEDILTVATIKPVTNQVHTHFRSYNYFFKTLKFTRKNNCTGRMSSVFESNEVKRILRTTRYNFNSV